MRGAAGDGRATVLVHHDAAPDGRGAPTPAWARHARRALASVDALVVFSEEDRRRSVGLGRGEDPSHPPRHRPAPTGEGPGRGVVFVGSFAHAPNLEAALRLAREIHPRVRSRLPDAELTLVGADPPPDLAGLPGVVVTGRVPDAAAFVNAAAVVAAPLESGAGVRIKVLDALARGKPLVATTRAVEGLELVDGEHALVRDDDVAFADALVALLDDPAARGRLGAAGRAWAQSNLSWDGVLDRYDLLYGEVAGE